MSKIKKNDPCHCGSGRKYKKCCYPKEMMASQPKEGMPAGMQPESKPKNTFRDMVKRPVPGDPIERARLDMEGLPIPEVLRRGQLALMAGLETRRAMLSGDRAHFSKAIALLKAHCAELKALPLSEVSARLGENAGRQIELLEQRLAECAFGPEDTANLEALQEVLEPGVADPPSASGADDLPEQELDRGPKDGPIMTDDDGVGVDDDDDDDDFSVHA